jgi:hypothetical protein
MDIFSKKAEISNLIKIRPVGVELFQADRQTDEHNKINRSFKQFCQRALKTFSFTTNVFLTFLKTDVEYFTL